MPRRISPLLLVLCLGIGSPLLASPSAPKGVQQAPQGVQTTPRADRFGPFWRHLTAFWAAAGCIIDPDGARCVANPTSPAGNTVVAPTAPAGCILDPNGCRP